MPRIEHVALFASDTLALKDFYVEAFGLRVVLDNGRTPPCCFVADDEGFAIELIPRPAGVEAVDQRYSCHLAFEVEDVHASRRELERRGVVFEPDTAVDDETMVTAFFHDPAGNRVQIVRRRKPLGD